MVHKKMIFLILLLHSGATIYSAAAPVNDCIVLPDLTGLTGSETHMQMRAIAALIEQNPTFIEDHINKMREQQVRLAVLCSSNGQSQKFLRETEGRSKVAKVLTEDCAALKKEEHENKPVLSEIFINAIGMTVKEVSKRTDKNLDAIERILDAASQGYVIINSSDLLELFRIIKNIKDENIANLDKESTGVVEVMGIALTTLFYAESEHITQLKKIQKQTSQLCKETNNDPKNASDDEGDEARNWSPKEVFEALKISRGPLQSGTFKVTSEYTDCDDEPLLE